MSDGHAAVRHVLLYESLDLLQIRDAVVDEEHLSVSRHLEVDGIGDEVAAIGSQLRVDGVAVGWGSADDAHVASPHQRELQRARDGRCRHRQRVHIRFQLAQLLLHRHAELLFLVDDEQSQVFPHHLLPDELVRAYQYVNLSLGEVGQNLLRLLRRARSREVFHAHRHVLQSVAECLEVLECQHRRRHHQRHLLRVACRLEGSTNGHLGLSESHVAAHQSVHGLRGFHVGLHLLRGAQLVRRVFIEERRLQLVLQICVGRVGEALLLLPSCIQAYQVAGDVLDALLRALLQPVPRPRAQYAQSWRLARVAAPVLTDFV